MSGFEEYFFSGTSACHRAFNDSSDLPQLYTSLVYLSYILLVTTPPPKKHTNNSSILKDYGPNPIPNQRCSPNTALFSPAQMRPVSVWETYICLKSANEIQTGNSQLTLSGFIPSYDLSDVAKRGPGVTCPRYHALRGCQEPSGASLGGPMFYMALKASPLVFQKNESPMILTLQGIWTQQRPQTDVWRLCWA